MSKKSLKKQPELVVTEKEELPVELPVELPTELPKEEPEEVKSILAPKVKKVLSDAQKANLEKGRLTRDANRKKRMEEKDTYIKQLQDKKVANIIKEKQKLKQIIGAQSDNEEQQEEEEEPEIIIKKKAPKKKKVIVLPESDDDVEEEIIYKKTKKQPINQPVQPVQPVNNNPRIVFF